MNIRIKPVTKIFSTLLLATGLCVTAQAQLLVQTADNFNLNGTTRTVGATLNGMAPTTGTGTWLANTAYTTFTAAGTISTPTNSQNPVGEINISTVTIPTMVQADVVTSSSSWMAVGFQSTRDPGNWFTTNDQLFVLLTPGGSLQLFDNNVHQVATATVSITNTAAYTLALQYNPATSRATVTLNGTAAISNVAVNVTAPIVSAGFFGNTVSTAGAASFDNFQVSTVPEPTTSVALVGGVFGLFVCTRIKRANKVVL